VIGDGDATHTLGNIDIQNAKEVHIGNGTVATKQATPQTTKVQGGKLYTENNASVWTVSATAYPGVEGQHAEEVIVKGGSVDFLYNRTVANIKLLGNGFDAAANEQYVGEAKVMSLECDQITGPVAITSKGQSQIQFFKAPVKMSNLTITSTLLPKDNENLDVIVPASANPTTTLQGALTGNGIFTAAQLAKAATITADVNLMTDQMDLNNLTWTGGDLQAKFNGFNYGKTTDDDMTSSKANLIKNLKLAKPDATGNGLFKKASTSATEIKGVKLETVKMEQNQTSPTDAPLGAFVGAATSAVTMDKVEVSGLVFSSKDGNIMGGLIGSISGADAIVSNAKVAGTITCRGFGGGMIGQLVANDATFTDCEASVTFTH
jgi:hypothetical protein